MQAYFTFLTALAVVNAGVIHPSAKIIQGPSSRSVVAGPDGSVISSVSPGATIIHEEHPGVVAHAAPVSVAHSVPIIVAHSSPVLGARTVVSEHGQTATHSGHPVAVAHAAPAFIAHETPVAVAHAAPIAVGTKTTVSEHGHSIETHSVHPAHVAVAHAAPVAVAHATPVAVAHADPVVVAHAAPVAVVGTKTTVSEHGHSIATHSVHPSPLSLAHANHVSIARVAPAAVAHAVPVTVSHTFPAAVVGTKTTVSEQGHSLATHSVHPVPVHVAHAPVIAHAGQDVVARHVVAHAVPVVDAYAAHGIHAHESTVVSGPSGTIATGKTLSAPALVATHGVHYVH